jgi:hypothetical protein
MPAATSSTDLSAILRPLLWLAAAAFLTGFGAYLTLGHPSVAAAQSRPHAVEISSGPSGDMWNLPKKI